MDEERGVVFIFLFPLMEIKQLKLIGISGLFMYEI